MMRMEEKQDQVTMDFLETGIIMTAKEKGKRKKYFNIVEAKNCVSVSGNT